MSARANTPDVAKAMEELEAQTSLKAREQEEPVAQEEAETYHNRREGPHVQKEDRERRSTTMDGASILANPDELRIEVGHSGGRPPGRGEDQGPERPREALQAGQPRTGHRR